MLHELANGWSMKYNDKMSLINNSLSKSVPQNGTKHSFLFVCFRDQPKSNSRQPKKQVTEKQHNETLKGYM